MESLPREMIITIFENLSLQDLVKTELVCKKFKDFVRSTKWSNVMVKLTCIAKILHVADTYQFLNYDFSESEITDYVVEKLSDCHTLNLRNCLKITDASISVLKCTSLDISSCVLVTDSSIQKLTMCRNLKLDWCNIISDECISSLKNCRVEKAGASTSDAPRLAFSSCFRYRPVYKPFSYYAYEYDIETRTGVVGSLAMNTNVNSRFADGIGINLLLSNITNRVTISSEQQAIESRTQYFPSKKSTKNRDKLKFPSVKSMTRFNKSIPSKKFNFFHKY